MIRILLATVLFSLAASATQAQLRSIPADAKRATLSHVQGMTVELDGKKTELAAGAQIRDANNLIVLPATLPSGSLVKFMPDAEGHIWRPGRLVELHNDVVEVSDGEGKVRRYVRVGGSPRTTDSASMKYRYGAGPRF